MRARKFALDRDRRFDKLATPRVDFLAIHDHVIGRRDSKPNTISSDIDHGHADIATDHNLFTDTSRKHQHFNSLLDWVRPATPPAPCRAGPNWARVFLQVLDHEGRPDLTSTAPDNQDRPSA
jgi:hypothetical protein